MATFSCFYGSLVHRYCGDVQALSWKKCFESVLVVLIKSGGDSMRRRVSSLSSCNCTDLRLLNLTERFRKMGSCEQLLVAQIKGRKWPELNALIFKGTLEKSPFQPVARWV